PMQGLRSVDVFRLFGHHLLTAFSVPSPPISLETPGREGELPLRDNDDHASRAGKPGRRRSCHTGSPIDAIGQGGSMLNVIAPVMLVASAALLTWLSVRARRIKYIFLRWSGVCLAGLLATAVSLLSLIMAAGLYKL